MAAENLLSASITNLDANPRVSTVSGEGAPGELKVLNDYSATTTAGLASTSSTYKIVRIPTNAKVKRMYLECDAAMDSNASPTLAADVGLYYSDATNDGTNPALQGTAVGSNVNQFLANTAFGSAGKLSIDITPTQAKRNQPLWQGVGGLSSDPGGYFDIVVAWHVAAATAVAGVVGVELEYVW